MTLRYASVCDGIGAVHVAWQPLGWRCAWVSEIDAFPSAVVDHHWDVENRGDMTRFAEWGDGPPIDVLVGGTPCQSFSVAGLRQGLRDPRGGLMLTFLEIARRYRPRWVVWENVPGVLSSHGGRDFGAFLGALGELGYGWAYRVCDAQWWGVAQRRRRVFAVGCLGDQRRAAAVLFERESVCRDSAPRRTEGKASAGRPAGSADSGGGRQPYAVANCLTRRMTKGINTTCNEGQTPVVIYTSDGVVADPISAHEARTYTHEGTTFRLHNCVGHPFTKAKRAQVSPTVNCFDQGDTRATTVVAFKSNGAKARSDAVYDEVSPTLSSNAGGNTTPRIATAMTVRRLTPRECERLQGFPDDYTAITYRGKPAADAPRYRALGNSMAVPVMRWIGSRIASCT